MTTTTTAWDATEPTHHDLVQRFPLRPLLNDAHHTDALSVLDDLLDRDYLWPCEDEYLERLMALIVTYEAGIPMHKRKVQWWEPTVREVEVKSEPVVEPGPEEKGNRPLKKIGRVKKRKENV